MLGLVAMLELVVLPLTSTGERLGARRAEQRGRRHARLRVPGKCVGACSRPDPRRAGPDRGPQGLQPAARDARGRPAHLRPRHGQGAAAPAGRAALLCEQTAANTLLKEGGVRGRIARGLAARAVCLAQRRCFAYLYGRFQALRCSAANLTSEWARASRCRTSGARTRAGAAPAAAGAAGSPRTARTTRRAGSPPRRARRAAATGTSPLARSR